MWPIDWIRREIALIKTAKRNYEDMEHWKPTSCHCWNVIDMGNGYVRQERWNEVTHRPGCPSYREEQDG
jgi:hypothetical protein